jgi:hypothetical protein
MAELQLRSGSNEPHVPGRGGLSLVTACLCATGLGRVPQLHSAASVQLAAVAKVLGTKVTNVQETTLVGERVLEEADSKRPQHSINDMITTWLPPLTLPSGDLSYSSNRLVGTISLDTRVTLNPMQVGSFYFGVLRTASCMDPKLTRPPPGAASTGCGHAPSVFVRQPSTINVTIRQAAIPSQSVLLLTFMVPTSVALGVVCYLVHRSCAVKALIGRVKHGKWKRVVRNEWLNM